MRTHVQQKPARSLVSRLLRTAAPVAAIVVISCVVGVLAGAKREAEAHYRIDLGDGRTVLLKCRQPEVESIDGKTYVRAGNHHWEAGGPVQIEMLLADGAS